MYYFIGVIRMIRFLYIMYRLITSEAYYVVVSRKQGGSTIFKYNCDLKQVNQVIDSDRRAQL